MDRRDKGKTTDIEQQPLLQASSAAAYQTDIGESSSANRPVVDGPSERRSRHRSRRYSLLRFLGNVLIGCAIVLALSILILRLFRVDDLRQEIMQSPQINIERFGLVGVNDEGAQVNVVGYTTIDYSHIEGSNRQWIVRTVTNMFKTLTVEDTGVKVYLERKEGEYAQAVHATIPKMEVNIGDGDNTPFDFVTTLSEFGNSFLVGTIIEKLLASEPITFRAVTDLPLSKLGINLGRYAVVVDQTVNNNNNSDGGSDVQIKVGDVIISDDSDDGVEVSTNVNTIYNFPISADIPGLIWKLKIPGCSSKDSDMILVSYGQTSSTKIQPMTTSSLTVTSSIHSVPQELVEQCKVGGKSPLDLFLAGYLSGDRNEVMIEGSEYQPQNTPSWLTDLMKQVKLKLPIIGKTNGSDLIRDLEFSDFKLSFFDKDWTLTVPQVSTIVRVTVQPPDSVDIDENLPVQVIGARGIADLYSKSQQFARVDIPDWVPCTTTRIESEWGKAFLVEFGLDSIPLNVTDDSLFGEVMRQVIFSGSSLVHVKSLVDARLSTSIGKFALDQIPAEGDANLHGE